MLDLALEIASKLPYKPRLCAIVTDKKGNILGIGTNSYTKSHPRQKYYSTKSGGSESRIYLHAELDSIIRARNGCPHAIYIARAKGAGNSGYIERGIAKPCPACERAIRDAGIREVHYTLG